MRPDTISSPISLIDKVLLLIFHDSSCTTTTHAPPLLLVRLLRQNLIAFQQSPFPKLLLISFLFPLALHYSKCRIQRTQLLFQILYLSFEELAPMLILVQFKFVVFLCGGKLVLKERALSFLPREGCFGGEETLLLLSVDLGLGLVVKQQQRGRR